MVKSGFQKGAVSLFIVSVLLIFSCKEETQVNTVEGMLYSDCGVPLSSAEVALKANPGGAYNDAIIIGTDVSESSGYFKIDYNLEEDKSGSADLILVRENGYHTLANDLELNEDHQLSVAEQITTEIGFTYTGTRNLTPQDTLFYGIQAGDERYKVGAQVGFSDTVTTTILNSPSNSRWTAFYFGLGKNDLKRSKEALTLQDSIYRNVWLELKACDTMKTFQLFF